MCKSVNIILSTPLRDNLQHWLGDFARLLKEQFTSNEGKSNDALPPYMSVKVR